VPAKQKTPSLKIAIGSAGDGEQDDFVVLERPRIVAPGRPEILLRDVRTVASRLAQARQAHLARTSDYLAAADEASRRETLDVPALAGRRGLDSEVLGSWLEYLGITGSAQLGERIAQQSRSVGNYDAVQGWTGPDALSVLANSSN